MKLDYYGISPKPEVRRSLDRAYANSSPVESSLETQVVDEAFLNELADERKSLATVLGTLPIFNLSNLCSVPGPDPGRIAQVCSGVAAVASSAAIVYSFVNFPVGAAATALSLGACSLFARKAEGQRCESFNQEWKKSDPLGPQRKLAQNLVQGDSVFQAIDIRGDRFECSLSNGQKVTEDSDFSYSGGTEGFLLSAQADHLLVDDDASRGSGQGGAYKQKVYKDGSMEFVLAAGHLTVEVHADRDGTLSKGTARNYDPPFSHDVNVTQGPDGSLEVGRSRFVPVIKPGFANPHTAA